MRRLVIRCPAKVNLHLEVLGRREDGFHEVRTLLVAVGLFDELELNPAPPSVLEVHFPGVPGLPADNTVFRAAQLLRQHFPQVGGAQVVVRKRIPVAAGLGGGSADGAAALVALGRLWNLSLSPGSLARLAARIGSDVPFFLWGGTCWAVGRGEEVYPLPDLPPYWVVLVPGRDAVPTAAVYGALKCGPFEGFRFGPLYDWLVGGGELPWQELRNDLQGTAVQLFPWIGEVLRRVRDAAPLVAMVSGSGGTVFAVFRHRHEAQQAVEKADLPQAVIVPVLARSQSQPALLLEQED
ncbi:MAG: 4-(cytidine 5'-diphospho)-2-C-methyl-D-erythritol kinase [Thermoanaerobaculum sp.]|nr:4-(cytidine 5'-diphospho)-2-C-methyl-D-erythritol kinase [Thermoanaerobaculum sp.]MDW7967772.1 4-(cytidine 5'-diphospho)-2-C-methyl-D-erythritol kinase [Thermoanaerobaculum sp.]